MSSAVFDAITSLERLSRVWAGDVGDASRIGLLSDEVRVRKEALFTIAILLPKLNALQAFEERVPVTEDRAHNTVRPEER